MSLDANATGLRPNPTTPISMRFVQDAVARFANYITKMTCQQFRDFKHTYDLNHSQFELRLNYDMAQIEPLTGIIWENVETPVQEQLTILTKLQVAKAIKQYFMERRFPGAVISAEVSSWPSQLQHTYGVSVSLHPSLRRRVAVL